MLLPPETLPELVARFGGYPPLSLILTDHGLVGLGQLLPDAQGRVTVSWHLLEAHDVGTPLVDQVLAEAVHTLRPSPLAWVLSCPEVQAAWRAGVVIDAVDDYRGEREVFLRVPQTLLLGLPEEPGIVPRFLSILAQLRPWAAPPTDWQAFQHWPVLVMGTHTDAGRLHWTGSKGAHEPAPAVLAVWQGLVREAMIAEQRRLAPEAASVEEGPPVSVQLSYNLLHGEAHERSLYRAFRGAPTPCAHGVE